MRARAVTHVHTHTRASAHDLRQCVGFADACSAVEQQEWRVRCVRGLQQHVSTTRHDISHRATHRLDRRTPDLLCAHKHRRQQHVAEAVASHGLHHAWSGTQRQTGTTYTHAHARVQYTRIPGNGSDASATPPSALRPYERNSDACTGAVAPSCVPVDCATIPASHTHTRARACACNTHSVRQWQERVALYLHDLLHELDDGTAHNQSHTTHG
jgi:hypothetical protein